MGLQVLPIEKKDIEVCNLILNDFTVPLSWCIQDDEKSGELEAAAGSAADPKNLETLLPRGILQYYP